MKIGKWTLSLRWYDPTKLKRRHREGVAQTPNWGRINSWAGPAWWLAFSFLDIWLERRK